MSTVSIGETLGEKKPGLAPQLTHGRDLSKRWTVVVLLAFPLLYAGVSQLLGQDADWDLQNYHFFDSYWLLVNHMRDLTPAQLQTYLSPILDVPFYFAADHLSPRLIGCLLAIIQGVSFPLLYFINRHFTPRRLVGLALAGLGMFTAGALSELGIIMGDTLVAPLLFGAILIGLRSLDASRPQEGKSMVPAALIVSASALAGVAAGLKLAELPIALGITAAFPLASGTPSQRILKGLFAGSGLVLGILLSYGWWGYELATRFGNPILPYMNQVFHSVYAPLAPNTDLRWPAHGIVNIIFYPILWTLHPTRVGEQPFSEVAVPILELLLIALVVASVVRGIAQHRRLAVFDNDKQRFLIVAVVISYIIWVLQFGYYRYFIPVEMLSFTSIFVCLQALRTRTGWKPIVRTGMVAVALICFVSELPANAGRSSWTASYFSASIPASLTKQSAAFLMLGWNPDSYIVTFFPQEDYFARIQGNLPPTPYLSRIIHKKIDAYQHIYIVWEDPVNFPTMAAFMGSANGSTAQFGLDVDWSRCIHFPSRVGAESKQFHVCQTKRPSRSG
jgi:hypothetical protein